jgi:Zn ribbon nucleic-acid-binding protein
VTEQIEEEVALPAKFNAGDRCDRCGAAAKSAALLENGILLFCGHHGREYQAALEDQGAHMEFDE